MVVELKQWSSARVLDGAPDACVVGGYGGEHLHPAEQVRRTGFGQVGCVYTAQGFEYDWSGVVLEPDLVWRSGRWVAQPEHSFDTAVKRAHPAEFDPAVHNTYKVLLTRGMLGSLLLSTDAETQDLLQSLLVPARLPTSATADS